MNSVNQITLAHVRVVGLFDRFTYDIAIHDRTLGSRNSITIISAPNGFGKSTILKIINVFFSSNLAEFVDYHFRAVHFFFTDRNEIVIEKLSTNGDQSTTGLTVRASLLDLTGSPIGATYQISMEPQKLSSVHWLQPDADLSDRLSADGLYFLSRITGSGLFRDFRDGAVVESSALEKFLRDAGSFPRLDSTQPPVPNWIHAYQESTRAFFVPASRIYGLNSNSNGQTESLSESVSNLVARCVAELQSQIEAVRVSQQRTFALRVSTRVSSSNSFSDYRAKPKSNIDLESRLATINDTVQKLRGLGIDSLDEFVLLLGRVQREHDADFFSAILEDCEEATAIAEPMLEKIFFFVKESNALLSYKFLEIRDKGVLTVISDRGNIVPVSSLSTGEQQLLLLISAITMEAPELGFLLVDEPELSIHPAWQERLMELIAFRSDQFGLKVLIATHSPTIAGKIWEQTLELTEQVVD